MLFVLKVEDIWKINNVPMFSHIDTEALLQMFLNGDFHVVIRIVFIMEYSVQNLGSRQSGTFMIGADLYLVL